MFGLAFYTFSESLRDRIYLGFLVGMALIVGILVVAGATPWGLENLVATRLGWSAVDILLAVLVSIYAVTNVVRERERRVLYMHLTLPLGRVRYLGGKALGIWLATFLLAVIGVVIILLGNRYLTHIQRYDWTILWLVPSVMLKSGVLISVAILFAQLATSTLSATLFTLGVYLIGNGANEILLLANNIGAELGKTLTFVYYIFPNLQLLDFGQASIYEGGVKASVFVQSAVYGMSYAGLAFVFSCILFRRKDL